MPEILTRIAVLASGRGSNLEAILKKQVEGYFQRAEVVSVFSDVPTAAALDITRTAEIEAITLPPKSFGSKQEYEAALVTHLDERNISLVALAGYMRIVGPTFLQHFERRIINIHPSLLPAFPGLHAQRQALEHGVKVSGCTVHFVDAGVDSGPIIGQRAVPVHDDDTEDTLSARILEQEHKLFSECLKRLTEEQWEIRDRMVHFSGETLLPV